ncbi:MFS transporter [Paenibacillus profundus]|uniref:MFS transporter n=1 Tax=Paenibacillus profundus TaxID=1173085 RepID=A0ABS8YQT4_9BACL|nr:MFS transporter [Paenibacillus profundus]MCE5172716.1 MFS transporter [Paenibacillus profundus]
METIKERANHIIRKLKVNRKHIKPLSAGWKGASFVLAAATLILVIMQANYLLGARGFIEFAVGTVISIVVVLIISGLLAIIVHGIKQIPSRYLWLFFSSFILLFICFMGPMEVSSIFVLLVIAILSLWGAILYKLVTGSYKHAKRSKKLTAVVLSVTTTVAIGIGGYWVVNDGDEGIRGVTLQELKTSARYTNHVLNNPAEEGPYPVKTLTYGSENSYRKEFNRSDSLTTKTVDGSAYVEKWSSLRTKTVGLGPDAMPVNGLVWYPEGEGPFPLVIIAHGNHMMTDYSDPGYDYLGELLASRGYIFVSIDENFLNVSPYDDMFVVSALEKENPARGLLMLEHIKAWKEWNSSSSNPFYQKVDMGQIALIGHSRGAEAITIAAAFNKLSTHPDNGNIKFDYNFHIRSLISIAGTDQQYRPSGKLMPLQNVNYLALHGAQDMDVNTFRGSSQYNRISFTDKEDFMKASVYIYGANHGQFNRVWSRGDGLGTANQLFNLKQLMARDEQETIAKVFISSFLDATLKNKHEYTEVFKDIGYAKEWLPDTMYISNYDDSQTTLIASFNEDIDLQSTTIPGGRLIGENLQEWKEEKVKMKFGEDQHSAVRLGWDRSKQSKAASYSVVMPDEGLDVGDNSSVVFSMADYSERKNMSYEEGLIDLTVKVEDKNGNQASLPLSHISKLLPSIEGKLLKRPFANFGQTKEPVFQNFSFQFNDFKQVNPRFNPQQVRTVGFEFDKTEKGTVLINNIGIRK